MEFNKFIDLTSKLIYCDFCIHPSICSWKIDEIKNLGENNQSMDSNDFQQMNDSQFIFWMHE
jgi:hypothetical protein